MGRCKDPSAFWILCHGLHMPVNRLHLIRPDYLSESKGRKEAKLKLDLFHLQGDTLSKIARKFETSIDVLSKLNGIRDADKIFAGKASHIHVEGCWK